MITLGKGSFESEIIDNIPSLSAYIISFIIIFLLAIGICILMYLVAKKINNINEMAI